MEKGNSIKSENGVFELILRESGNLELICRDTLIWESSTANSDVDVFQYKSNGNLVISRKNGTYAWESKTVCDEKPSDRLVLQNDGNVVLYAGGEAKWSTKTHGKCATGNFLFSKDMNKVFNASCLIFSFALIENLSEE